MSSGFWRRSVPSLRLLLLCLLCMTGVVQAAPQVVPNDGLPQEVIDKIIKRYDSPYITFDAEIVTYIPMRPGFILVPEEQIAPGTVFKVAMSRRGDLRADLLVQGELRFTHQVAVDRVSSSGEAVLLPRYAVTEIDHLGKLIYTTRVNTQKETYDGVSLSDEVFDHSTWCASGVYVKPFLGHTGRIATYYVEELKTGHVVSGPVKDDRSLYRVKIIRTPQTTDDAGFYHYLTVDGTLGFVLEEEYQVHHPGKTPQTVRMVRFRNIRFPKVLKNSADIFENIPKAARSYRRWEEKTTADHMVQEGDKK